MRSHHTGPWCAVTHVIVANILSVSHYHIFQRNCSHFKRLVQRQKTLVNINKIQTLRHNEVVFILQSFKEKWLKYKLKSISNRLTKVVVIKMINIKDIYSFAFLQHDKQPI